MKKGLRFFLELIITVVGYYLLAFLFAQVFGMIYHPAGQTGGATPMNLAFSCFILVALIAISFFSGYKARNGIFFGLLSAFAISKLALVLYFINPIAVLAYFYFIPPFGPITDVISRWMNTPYSGVFIGPEPVIWLSYILFTAAFVIGVTLKKRKKTSS